MPAVGDSAIQGNGQIHGSREKKIGHETCMTIWMLWDSQVDDETSDKIIAVDYNSFHYTLVGALESFLFLLFYR